DTLLQVGISNALAATVLALLAAAAGHFARRPALAHGLWLLVLLKLVTPPLWHVRLPDLARHEPTAATPTAAAGELAAAPAEEEDALAGPEGEDAVPAAPEAALVLLPPAVANAAPVPVPEDAPSEAAEPAAVQWKPALFMLWLIGSCAWFGLA